MKLDKQTMKKLMFLITFTIVLFFALTHIDTVINGVGFVIGLISPLLFGFGIAFVLNVPLRYIESRLFFSKNKVVQKIKRPVSILLSIIIILLFITAVLLLVIPEVIKTFNILIDLIPDFFEKIKIVDGKPMAKMKLCFFKKIRTLLNRFTIKTHLCRFVNQKPLTQRSS